MNSYERKEKYQQLLAEYEAKYPNESSPERSSGGILDIDTMISILEEAKGRRIRFVQKGTYSTPKVKYLNE